MLPYWIIFGAFAAGALLYKPWNRRGQLPITPLLIPVALLTLFVGLRYEVGADWPSYEGIFDYAERKSFLSLMRVGDPGFFSLVWLAHQLNQQLWFLNLMCASALSAGLVAFARRQPNPWLVIAVALPYLVIVVGMSGTRQATAIGFVLLALAAYSDGKIVRAALWILVGSLFHASAVLMVGVLAISYSRNRLVAAGILGATLIVGYFTLSSSLNLYIERYADPRVQSHGTAFRLAMNLLPAILYLARPTAFKPRPQDHALWRNLSILALLCVPALFLVPSSTALDRLSLYIIPLQLYVLGRLPHALSKTREEYYPFVMRVIAYLALVMFVFFAFSLHGQYWVPYQVFPLF